MDKQAILDNINHAIILLGTMRVRVDEIGPVGVPVSEAIQCLGKAVELVNESSTEEAKPDEQEDNNK